MYLHMGTLIEFVVLLLSLSKATVVSTFASQQEGSGFDSQSEQSLSV